MFDELRDLNNEIKRKQEQIAEIRSALTSSAMPLGVKVQTSPEDRLSALMCKLIMLENELDGMVDNYADLKRDATQKIFALKNEDWQDIVYAHYIEFKSFNEIARSKGWSKNKVTLKNNRAIKVLRKSMIDETIRM